MKVEEYIAMDEASGNETEDFAKRAIPITSRPSKQLRDREPVPISGQPLDPKPIPITGQPLDPKPIPITGQLLHPEPNPISSQQPIPISSEVVTD